MEINGTIRKHRSKSKRDKIRIRDLIQDTNYFLVAASIYKSNKLNTGRLQRGNHNMHINLNIVVEETICA